MTPLRRESQVFVVKNTTLSLEPLEQRLLLSGTSLSRVALDEALPVSPASLQVSTEWFQPLAGAMSSGSMVQQYGTSQFRWQGQKVQAVNNEWIVQFTDAAMAGISAVGQTAGLLPAGVQFQVQKGLGMAGQVLIRTSGASVDAVKHWLNSAASVASFSPDTIITISSVPNDPMYGQQWDLENTGQYGGVQTADTSAQSAWDLSTGSSDVVVAVVDTGVDYTHPDLAANMWVNPGEIPGNGVDDDGNGFIDDIYGWDFFSNDNNPMDEVTGHGTHVAGTIGAVTDNGVGIAGINWDVSIMALRFLGPAGGTADGAIQAVNYATMMRTRYNADSDTGANVKVINASYGSYGFDQGERDSIEAFGVAGGLFVAAAGNDATNNDTLPFYPSSYDPTNVISVAATDQSDHLASFSNYGAKTVDIAAPGVGIYSTLPTGGSGMGQNYGFAQGTSMAAPHVAGAAALAWAYNPDATMVQVRDAILSGSMPLTSLAGKTVTGGRLDLRATLERVMYDDPLHIQTASAVNGDTTLTVYDMRGRVDTGPQDVQMTFGEGGVVSSVKIGGSGGGAGIFISGASSIGSIKDGRSSTEPIAVIAADAPIKSISLKNGLSGTSLDGLTLGGLTFEVQVPTVDPDPGDPLFTISPDIDQDGSTSDYTGIYDTEAIQKVSVQGPVTADIFVGGHGANGLSLGSLATKKGNLYGDVYLEGGAGNVKVGGNLEHDAVMTLGGNSGSLSLSGAMAGQLRGDGASLSKLQVKGNLEGLVDLSGSLGSASVGGAMLPGAEPLIVQSGLPVFGGAVRVLGGIGSFSVKGAATDAWITGGSMGNISFGGNVSTSQISSLILAGTDFGADWALGGTGADADTFLPASIGSATIKGTAADTRIGAGLSPVGGSLDLAAIEASGAFLFGSHIDSVHVWVDFTGTPGASGIGAYQLGTVGIGKGTPTTIDPWHAPWAEDKTTSPMCFYIVG